MPSFARWKCPHCDWLGKMYNGGVHTLLNLSDEYNKHASTHALAPIPLTWDASIRSYRELTEEEE